MPNKFEYLKISVNNFNHILARVHLVFYNLLMNHDQTYKDDFKKQKRGFLFYNSYPLIFNYKKIIKIYHVAKISKSVQISVKVSGQSDESIIGKITFFENGSSKLMYPQKCRSRFLCIHNSFYILSVCEKIIIKSRQF